MEDRMMVEMSHVEPRLAFCRDLGIWELISQTNYK